MKRRYCTVLYRVLDFIAWLRMWPLDGRGELHLADHPPNSFYVENFSPKSGFGPKKRFRNRFLGRETALGGNYQVKNNFGDARHAKTTLNPPFGAPRVPRGAAEKSQGTNLILPIHHKNHMF